MRICGELHKDHLTVLGRRWQQHQAPAANVAEAARPKTSLNLIFNFDEINRGIQSKRWRC